jgi:hypothetical protein
MFALLKQMTDIDAHAPSAVFRLAANTGADKFYGKKYVLDIVSNFKLSHPLKQTLFF